MKFITDTSDILSALCKANNKFGMKISCSYHSSDTEIHELEDMEDDLESACPTLKQLGKMEWLDFQCNGYNGYLLFDSEGEMKSAYHSTVGDDGATSSNKYNGPVRVYALTCDNNGKLMNENT